MLNLVLAEILKQYKLGLIRSAVLAPPVLSIGILCVLFLAKAAGSDFGGLTESEELSGPALGTGAFTLGAGLVLQTLGGFYGLVMVIVATSLIYREYAWNTIKMIAIREPSRPRLVLSKVLFMAFFTLVLIVVFMLTWLIYSFGLKFAYDAPLGITNEDLSAIAGGLRFVSIAFLIHFIWSLSAMMVSMRFKSNVASIIAYVVYSGVDNAVASIGAAAPNQIEAANTPNWLAFLLEAARIIAPFTINASFARIAKQPNDLQYIASTPPLQAVLVLVAWATIFVLLTIQIFANRDITD